MRNIIRLGKISKIYNQFGIIRAQVIILDPNNPEDVVLLNPYGFNSCPKVGAMCEVHTIFGYAESTYAIPFDPTITPKLKIGESIVYDSFGNSIYLKEDGSMAITSSGPVSINSPDINASGNISAQGFINTQDVYKVKGVQVLTERQPAIPDPAGGAVVDAEARTAIISILNALRIHGEIAT